MASGGKLFYTHIISDFCYSMQALKQFIKGNFGNWIYRRQMNPGRKNEMDSWLQKLQGKQLDKLSDASYDVFTYHGEDGILLYLLSQLKEVPAVFIDIGAGDCIKSNCANLVTHFGWCGTFIDKDKNQLSVGRRLYKARNVQGIRFVDTEVTVNNVNQLITEAAAHRNIGLLSIDIDGNDYWIWKAIEVVQPAIVLIEAKVEFGHHSLVVPYGPNNHRSVNKEYNGASVEALRKLGEAKGYKLVGANKQGYNLFFVREEQPLRKVLTNEILDDPETMGSFYPEYFFTSQKFESV